ncbi:hypothetical protein IFM89_011052, partial [Coptis chinensis]
MAAVLISTSLSSKTTIHHHHHSSSGRLHVSGTQNPRGLSFVSNNVNNNTGLPFKFDDQIHHRPIHTSYGPIEAKKGNPPVMPAVMTPGGPLDLSSVLFRNRIIFIGQPINSQVAQRVISQLVTLATIDEDADILIYLNCPGGSTYSVLAIYDCMSWVRSIVNHDDFFCIKPKVGTVCFGVAASQGALLLAGGEKGMRYAMPNARIMIHQPQSGCGGHVEDVRRQVNEAVQARHLEPPSKSVTDVLLIELRVKLETRALLQWTKKIDKMYAAFTGQPFEEIQNYTERDRFFSTSEVLLQYRDEDIRRAGNYEIPVMLRS